MRSALLTRSGHSSRSEAPGSATDESFFVEQLSAGGGHKATIPCFLGLLTVSGWN